MVSSDSGTALFFASVDIHAALVAEAACTLMCVCLRKPVTVKELASLPKRRAPSVRSSSPRYIEISFSAVTRNAAKGGGIELDIELSSIAIEEISVPRKLLRGT